MALKIITRASSDILIEDLEDYLSVCAGRYDEAREAEGLLEEALDELIKLRDAKKGS